MSNPEWFWFTSEQFLIFLQCFFHHKVLIIWKTTYNIFILYPKLKSLFDRFILLSIQPVYCWIRFVFFIKSENKPIKQHKHSNFSKIYDTRYDCDKRYDCDTRYDCDKRCDCDKRYHCDFSYADMTTDLPIMTQ